jgi:hypothetical protein
MPGHTSQHFDGRLAWSEGPDPLDVSPDRLEESNPRIPQSVAALATGLLVAFRAGVSVSERAWEIKRLVALVVLYHRQERHREGDATR